MRRDSSPVQTSSGLTPADPCTSSFLLVMKKWRLQVRRSRSGLRLITTDGLRMTISRSSMPCFASHELSYQLSLNKLTPLTPLHLSITHSLTHSLSLSIAHIILGTSFLNRTEAASVEKIVTMYLKNGITPDQIGVRHSFHFNPYYPSLFFFCVNVISV